PSSGSPGGIVSAISAVPSARGLQVASHPARLAAVATALPAHHVSQTEARAFIAEMFARTLAGDASRLLAVFDRSGISSRYTCMPIEWYREPHEFGETNARYLEHALDLARAAARS